MPIQRRPVWQQRLEIVVAYQAPVLWAIGIALLAPLVLAFWDARGLPPRLEIVSFLLPALLAIALGLAIRLRRPSPASLSQTEALLATTAAWLTASVIGALPFILLLDIPLIESVFETVSGFTTAGTTMLVHLDTLPRSILLWRSLTQWLGGLGILVIILLVGQSRGSQALSLLNAEGVKVNSGRLSLNFQRATVKFLQIYVVLTVAQAVITLLLGMPLFDSVNHAMTTVSTGGFSPHDESLAFYANRPSQFPNYVAMELVIIVFMLAGGINFFIHYRLVRRREIRALWDGMEMRILWIVLAVTTASVALVSWRNDGGSLSDWTLRSGFAVASLISTTGYEITPTGAFPRLAREIFLLLMVLGGTAGSTAGGIKLIRAGMLGKLLSFEVRKLRLPPHAVHPPAIDGKAINEVAFRQAVFILLLWLGYIVVGGLAISLMAPELQIADAYSIVFSAIGVYGPSFVPVQEVIALPGAAKSILIVGMLAGRLEILPLLVFFNLAAWRR